MPFSLDLISHTINSLTAARGDFQLVALTPFRSFSSPSSA